MPAIAIPLRSRELCLSLRLPVARAMDFSELEASEGLRWSWHAWPHSLPSADTLVIPLSILICPLSPIPDLPSLPCAPLRCSSCHGVLNPYARLDPSSKLWTCPFCLRRNALPFSHHHYASNDSIPAELFPTHTCIEYLPPPPVGAYAVTYPLQQPRSPPPPAFLFVVDTCIPPGEFSALKKSISQTLSLLPGNAVVGLLSFGSQVHVHDLSPENHYAKALVFHGERELTPVQIRELLGISTKNQRHKALKQRETHRFLVSSAENEFNFTAVLEDLQSEFDDNDSKHRPQRATGVVLAIAVSLLEDWETNAGSRILLFVGGPATVGQGKVVGTTLEESMRTHKDIRGYRAQHFRRAEKFYKSIENTMVAKGLVLDVFACSLDQVGIYEMKPAIEVSGGLLVLAETFDSGEFNESLRRLFALYSPDGFLKTGFNATLEVITSPKVKVLQALGPCTFLGVKNNSKEGEKAMWKMCTLNEKTNLAFIFEVSNQSSIRTQPGAAFLVQFVTKYHKSDGQVVIRVTTTARRWVDESQFLELAAGFDQEAAAAIIARIAVQKASDQDVLDVIRWLENTLIRFAAKYGDYQKEVPESFQLSSNFSSFPELMFNLRRSQFLQIYSSTPDETAFFWLMLNRSSVAETVVMIQPTLFAYSLDGPPRYVPLDISSIKANTVLLFDAFFVVLVHYGSMISQWRKLNYHAETCHDNFKKLLEDPIVKAQSILGERNPLPKFIQCNQYSSQARFLLSRLNPSITHKSENVGDSDLIFTDDMSLGVFMDHLQDLAVKDGYI